MLTLLMPTVDPMITIMINLRALLPSPRVMLILLTKQWFPARNPITLDPNATKCNPRTYSWGRGSPIFMPTLAMRNDQAKNMLSSIGRQQSSGVGCKLYNAMLAPSGKNGFSSSVKFLLSRSHPSMTRNEYRLHLDRLVKIHTWLTSIIAKMRYNQFTNIYNEILAIVKSIRLMLTIIFKDFVN